VNHLLGGRKIEKERTYLIHFCIVRVHHSLIGRFKFYKTKNLYMKNKIAKR
jgi:hypothetical protein